MLELQYRMCQDIMSVCNLLVYNHRLRCGSEDTARARLDLRDLTRVPPGWLRDVCAPQRRVVLVDTDAAALGEYVTRLDTLHNPGEARVVLALVRALVVTGGLDARALGIITPFRSQMQLLQDMLTEQRLPPVECNTIDRCQGRDWECVVLTLVRSNDRDLVGDLLMDWRRLNVALTRAKRKLIVVADPHTLRRVPTLAQLFDLCAANQWVVPLPRGAADE